MSSVFSGCTSLTTIHIGENVKRIPDDAFYGCKGLTSITIPESVATIGNEAFYGCSNLQSVTVYNPTPVKIVYNGTSVFDGVDYETCKLYVPVGSVDAYKAATGWKKFGTIEEFVPPTGKYFIPTRVTPADGAEVTELAEFTLLFDEKPVLVGDSATLMKADNSAFFPAGIVSSSDSTLTISLTDTVVTEPGDYLLTIPEGAFGNEIYFDDQTTGRYNPELVYTYTIKEPVVQDFKPATTSPADNSEVEALKTITLIFTEKPALAAEAQTITLAGNDTLLTATLSAGEGNTLEITLADTLKAAGEYTLTIPEGTFGDADFADDPTVGHCNPELVYTFTITEPEPAEPDEPENPDDPSAVTETQQDAEHITVYNLQGVLILETNDAAALKTLQNGAYIVNGKKMIIVR